MGGGKNVAHGKSHQNPHPAHAAHTTSSAASGTVSSSTTTTTAASMTTHLTLPGDIPFQQDRPRMPLTTQTLPSTSASSVGSTVPVSVAVSTVSSVPSDAPLSNVNSVTSHSTIPSTFVQPPVSQIQTHSHSNPIYNYPPPPHSVGNPTLAAELMSEAIRFRDQSARDRECFLQSQEETCRYRDALARIRQSLVNDGWNSDEIEDYLGYISPRHQRVARVQPRSFACDDLFASPNSETTTYYRPPTGYRFPGVARTVDFGEVPLVSESNRISLETLSSMPIPRGMSTQLPPISS